MLFMNITEALRDPEHEAYREFLKRVVADVLSTRTNEFEAMMIANASTHNPPTEKDLKIIKQIFAYAYSAAMRHTLRALKEQAEKPDPKVN
jgi:hypothetical protein